MVVTGLNSNRFLAGNPVPVTITQSSGTFATAAIITMTITKLATHPSDMQYTLPPVKLYPPSDGITFDLAPYIKGLLPEPYVPTTNYQNPVPNFQRFNITFNESQSDTSAAYLNKAFVRGFKRTKSNQAITLSSGEVLSPSPRIPVWPTFPSAYFTIDATGNIIPSTVVPTDVVKQMNPPASCDPFYVRFLNSLGGYSFWMFNAWEWEANSNSVGVIERTTSVNNKSLGFREESQVTLDTRVKREFFPLLRDLIVSPVVQVYNQFETNGWLKIELQDGSFSENNYEDLVEFTCKADLMLNVNPQVVW